MTAKEASRSPDTHSRNLGHAEEHTDRVGGVDSICWIRFVSALLKVHESGRLAKGRDEADFRFESVSKG